MCNAECVQLPCLHSETFRDLTILWFPYKFWEILDCLNDYQLMKKRLRILVLDVSYLSYNEFTFDIKKFDLYFITHKRVT